MRWVFQVTTEGLPRGNYDLFFYGRCGHGFEGSAFELFVDGVSKGIRGNGGSDFTGNFGVDSTNWIEGVHYALFRNVAFGTNSSARVVVIGAYVACASGVIAGMQISPALAQPQVPLCWLQPKSGVFPPGTNFTLGTTVTGQLPVQ